MREINLLSKEEAAAELESIATEMAKADIAYYQNDNPYLTDAEYDALKKRNQEIEARQPVSKSRRSPQKRFRQNSPPLSHAFLGRYLHD